MWNRRVVGLVRSEITKLPPQTGALVWFLQPDNEQRS